MIDTMKKRLPLWGLAALLVSPFCAQAQDNEYQRREVIVIDDERPRVVDERREIVIRDEPDDRRGGTVVLGDRRIADRGRTYRDGVSFLSTVSLGYNGLVEDLGTLRLPEGADYLSLKPRSLEFKLMLVDYHVPVTRWLGLQAGLELEVNNYLLENNITLTRNDAGTVVPDLSWDNRGIDLRKSKLVNSYFNVPLLLRVNLGPTTEIFGGVTGGLRWNSYQKIKVPGEGRDRLREELNLRNFHYGYTAGVQFDHLGFYATYHPHSMFKTPGGEPDVRQVGVGVSLRY